MTPWAELTSPLIWRDRKVFKSWLLHGAKEAAAEHGFSRSTLSNTLDRVFKRLGLCCTPMRLPLHFYAIAQADELGVTLQKTYAWPVLTKLNVSLGHVAGLVLQGASMNEICAQRGTAYRTVANQLSDIYGRYGVSSALEFKALVGLMIAERWKAR